MTSVVYVNVVVLAAQSCVQAKLAPFLYSLLLAIAKLPVGL